ncbi:MAG: thymidylate synthase [Longimicrobiaceae bacterium]
MIHMVGRTADEVWRRVAALFDPEGPAHRQDGRGGETLEVMHAVLAISEPRQRWIYSRVPALNPAFALVEVIWILAGRRDLALPAHWNPRLPKYSGAAAEQEGAYGYRLRSHFGLDQLDRVYRVLDSAPNTRQAVLQIWDPVTDLPSPDGAPRRPDIPCNVSAFPKVRGGRLEWLQILRSNDVFRGLPYNIVQFTSLQEVLAGWLGVEMGEYVHVSDSLHAYAADVAVVRDGPNSSVRQVVSTDNLALPRQLSEAAIRETNLRLSDLARGDVGQDEFRRVALTSSLPEGFENIVRIAAADSARRRRWTDLSEACGAAVTNPALQTAWAEWSLRNLPADPRP